MNLELGSLQSFDCKSEPSSLGTRWIKWKRSFVYYLEAKGIEKDKQKKALLLHCAGSDAEDIFSTLTDPGPVGEQDTEYQKAVRTLDAYFKPQVNTPFERHVFRQAKQKTDETLDQYLTRLSQLAENCAFGDVKDEQIRDQFINKCRSHNLRKKLLESGGTLALKRAQEIARAMEAAENQAKSIEHDFKSGTGSVNTVGARRKTPNTGATGKQSTCFRRGKEGRYHYGRDPMCKAGQASCNKCNKVGHFAKVRKTKTAGHAEEKLKKDSKYSGRKGNVRQVSKDKYYTFMVNFLGHQAPTFDIELGGVELKDVLVDSGSTCNVVDRETWDDLKRKEIKCTSWKLNKKLHAYGSEEPLSTIGEFATELKYSDRYCSTCFVVIEQSARPILSRLTCEMLGVLRIDVNAVEEQDLLEEYKECFSGVGKLKNSQTKLHVDEKVAPFAQKLRPIPFGLRERPRWSISLKNLSIMI